MIMKSPFSWPSTPSRSPMRYTPPSSPMSRHTLSDSLVEENVEIAEAVISRWDPAAASSYSKGAATPSLFKENLYEAKQFLNCIKNLQAAMHYYVKVDSGSEKLVRAHTLMQMAMRRLEKDFYDILSTNKEYLDHEMVSSRGSVRSASVSDYEDESEEDDFRFASPESSSSAQSQEDRASLVVMSDLKAIADCMIATGYGKECVKIYKIVRKSIVDEALYHLGVDRSISLKDLQKMEWEALERKIRGWLRAVKVSVRTIFYGERILCDHVFSASVPIQQSCFSEITRDGALALFGFPESASKSKKLSAEKMFRTLDMYEAIANLWPEIESIFSYNSTSDVRVQAVNSLIKVADAARFMMADFETAIEKHTSKSPMPGGGVHPLTRYVMNYLSFLADYSDILSDIIADWPVKGQTNLPESYFSIDHDSFSSATSARIAWVVLLLMCKLDGKAELQKDVALSYLFLANNLQYILSKVQHSNLKDLLGYDWVSKHESKVKQYVVNYERVGWSRVSETLPAAASHIDPNIAREYFKKFNMEFETVYQKQLNWVVSDPKLRSEIKGTLARKLLPPYTSLYQSHGVAIRRGAFRESIVRFSPEDVGNYLSDLFSGNGELGSVSSHSHSSSTSSTSSGRAKGR